MTPFIQDSGHQTTIDHWESILQRNGCDMFSAFAYATDSGVAQMITRLSKYIGEQRETRWLIGIDYGRSHPTAIKKLSEIPNSEVRVHDGGFVVHADGFVPRISFHLKTTLTLDAENFPQQQLVGSGNLSASGLSGGIEAGSVVDFQNVERTKGENLILKLEELWQNATPLDSLIGDYEQRYVSNILPIAIPSQRGAVLPTSSGLFWIDVGYVTKNRGAEKAGNQFDLPRGAHVLLGLDEVENPELNSVLGELAILTPTGETVSRSLRFGNNSMEKLTLPIPENYGYDCYDGKILTFEVNENHVVVNAFEHEDFYRVFGSRILSRQEMQSGRNYGTAEM